jgi:alpha-tubulin suppressor-like RCC1 family protein
VSGLSDVSAVSGGSGHTLALKPDGSVLAWGSNSTGALGDGTETDRRTPGPVQISGVSAIVASTSFSVALKRDGTVWAWGGNGSGQLGSGTADAAAHPLPTQVPNLDNVQSIVAGNAFVLALKKDGTVWGWGSNAGGQLCNPIVGSLPVLPPTLALGVSDIRAIAAGDNWSAFLKSDGTVVLCGQRPITFVNHAVPIPIAGLTNLVSITAGGGTLFGFRADGKVWGWGSNVAGTLGDSSENVIQDPAVEIPGLAGVKISLGIGGGRTHALGIKPDGTVLAWGGNDFGRLGIGPADFERHPTPTAVPGLASVIAVSAGGMHSLALAAPAQTLPIAVAVGLPSLDVCRLRDWACRAEPKLTPGNIGLRCDLPNCVVIDPIPKNCQAKFKCPGCSPGSKCPPVYSIVLEGLGDVWRVGLFNGNGDPVQHSRTPIRNGVVISFQPSKESYIEGLIGDYLLGFQMGPKGKVGADYNIKTRLIVGDNPYDPSKGAASDKKR